MVMLYSVLSTVWLMVHVGSWTGSPGDSLDVTQQHLDPE